MPIYKVDGIKKDGLQKYNVRVNYVDNTGKPRQPTRTAYGLEAAKKLESELLQTLGLEGNLAKKITFKQLYDEFIASKEVREITIREYENTIRNYILPYFEKTRIDKITAKSLQDWKDSLNEKPLLISTKQSAYTKFKTILKYAVKMEYLQKSPISKIETFKDNSLIKKEMDYYTVDEFKVFIKAAKQYAEDACSKGYSLREWDYYVFFCIAFYTGLRKSEILALRWDRIDGAFLSVKEAIVQNLNGKRDVIGPPKSKSAIRTIQIPVVLMRILNEHKQRQIQLGHFKESFFVCGGEETIHAHTARLRKIKYAEMAGLKDIRTHDFRHSHVSVLVNEKINIVEISRRLGHSKVEITWNTYSHMYPRENEKAAEVFDLLAA